VKVIAEQHAALSSEFIRWRAHGNHEHYIAACARAHGVLLASDRIGTDIPDSGRSTIA